MVLICPFTYAIIISGLVSNKPFVYPSQLPTQQQPSLVIHRQTMELAH